MTAKLTSETLDELLRRYLDEDTYSFEGVGQLEVNSRGRELESPLHMAVTRGAVNDVRLLLGGGADVNARTDVNMTPLHRAVCGGNVEIVSLLLAAGAEAQATCFGQTALQVAKELGFQEIVDLLRRAGGKDHAS